MAMATYKVIITVAQNSPYKDPYMVWGRRLGQPASHTTAMFRDHVTTDGYIQNYEGELVKLLKVEIIAE